AHHRHLHSFPTRRSSDLAQYSPKVAAACTAAKDGYKADLNIEPEFFGINERAYMFARFQHKRFSWGSAVSFLSQAVQEPALYVRSEEHTSELQSLAYLVC